MVHRVRTREFIQYLRQNRSLDSVFDKNCVGCLGLTYEESDWFFRGRYHPVEFYRVTVRQAIAALEYLKDNHNPELGLLFDEAGNRI